MGGGATNTRASEPEKNSRDERGRFKAGCSGNPRGAQPLTPERRAVRDLAAAERGPNIATLVSIRDSSKDEWARIEACKLLLMYSDGKPVTAAGPMVAVQVNQTGGAASFNGHSDPVEATVLLATQGDAMPEDQREAIVASTFARANANARRVAALPRAPAPSPEAGAPPSAEGTAPPEDPRPASTTSCGREPIPDPPAPAVRSAEDEALEDFRRLGGAPPPEPTDDQGETFMTLEEAIEQMDRQERAE